MEIFELSVPAKTFMLGEYVVLKGGPALILCTAPRFILHVTPNIHKKENFFEGIHPESPGGKLIHLDSDFYSQYHLHFIDPYHGIGGLGASSAQFAMLYALKFNRTEFEDKDFADVRQSYLNVAWHEGVAPSGADVIAQLKGGLCFLHPVKKNSEILSWPFSQIDFCLIHTGNKLATHEYLKNLTNVDITGLEIIVENAVSSLKSRDIENFIACIKAYGELLDKQNHVTHNTQTLLKKIGLQPGVLAAKGCGALGADIVFVLLEKSNRHLFSEWCKNNMLPIMNIGQKVSTGLEWVRR